MDKIFEQKMKGTVYLPHCPLFVDKFSEEQESCIALPITMGKKQHQKDKLYLTTTEWKETYGGHKDDTGKRMQRALFKRLPITHCSLSLLPFEDPVCSRDGIIFDLTQIIPYLKKYGINPVTGKKMTAKELIHLKFDKDSDGNFRCPVTFRVFTPTSHIVTICQTGNVYSLEAIEELNLKPGHLRDLLTDEPFQRKDIKIEETEEEEADEVNAAHYSQGRVAAGLTSTMMEPITQQKAAVLDADTVKYARVNKNGYVRIITNYGAINLELYCKDVPRACENFIKHCKSGYYNNTKFHRVIRNFMMQGGDPTGTGKGGDSIWGKPFKDEIIRSFSHNQRGILSMANQGTDTNKSQFFITFRSCSYLDGKHSIFGRVVGGTGTLAAIERVETDEGSRPIADVFFLNSEIFVDPFEEAEAAVAKERENIRLAKTNQESEMTVSEPTIAAQIPKPKEYGTGVGKYINLPELVVATKRMADVTEFGIAKKTVKPNQIFGDFSSW
uniref:RING-type E3 ubiquitin-protein ligase PPIL2 n=1 Tax=Wuchereria bancrofti TaxID=6293 RepID=A0A1I8EVD6_WUCBA